MNLFSMLHYCTSSLLYNEIEFLSFLNQYLVLLLVLLIVLFQVIYSSRVLIPCNVQAKDTFIESIITLWSLSILVMLISPSLILLFEEELIMVPSIALSTIGYQWIWSFDIAFANFRYVFDVSIIPCSLLQSYKRDPENSYDMLSLVFYDLNSFILIPLFSLVKIVVFSFDVIHSFSIYSLGLKIDAIPGRFNSTGIIRTLSKGEIRGWCFELCGSGHSSMLFSMLILDMLYDRSIEYHIRCKEH